MNQPNNTELLNIRNLSVEFPLPARQILTAVDRVDLVVYEGEAHGLIGESGCGKSVTALAALGLLDPTARVSGEIAWLNRSVSGLDEREWRMIRGRGMAMLFQDAMASLNPALRIGPQLRAVLKLHQQLQGENAQREAVRILQSVRLADPLRVLDSYPHECSGGMAQRVALALALACRPRLLIADEPTSALDVTVAVQIMELLRAILREYRLSLLFISHDLGMISRLCNRVSVMYLGRIVETGPAEVVLSAPKHPYTVALLNAASWRAPGTDDPIILAGEPDAALIIATGCKFSPRCTYAQEQCRREAPPLSAADSTDWKYACWFPIT
jgi:oligopeptide/dipeptide ABC transporter ATP-binding protein